MFRLLLIFVTIHSISGHRHWCREHPNSCHHHHHDYQRGEHENDGEFHHLSWDVIKADRKAQRSCTDHTNHISEVYFKNHYRLTVQITDFTEEEISVKVKHRVLFIQAVKPDNAKEFSEVKILPELVKASDATWNFVDGQLSVYIPYRAPVGTEVTRDCSSEINESVIVLAKAVDIDVRFGPDETTEIPFNENVV